MRYGYLVLVLMLIGLASCSSGGGDTVSTGDDSGAVTDVPEIEPREESLVGTEWLVEGMSGFSREATAEDIELGRSAVSFFRRTDSNGEQIVFLGAWDGCNGGSRPISWTDTGLRVEANSGSVQGVTTERRCSEGVTPLHELLVAGRTLSIVIDGDALTLENEAMRVSAVRYEP